MNYHKENMMSDRTAEELAELIMAKAKEFGADLAGIARVEDLKQSPSHLISERMPDFANVAAKEVEGRRPGQVDWPEGAKSVIVIAIEHPEDKLEMDWWILGGKSVAGNTPGNKLLIAAANKLADWIEQELGMTSYRTPYHIELGAIYMKDAAVLAGLGCIGKNNILVTPEFGPRQRLRVIMVDADLPATGPSDFDPCHDCDMPCRAACPANAFGETLYTKEEYGFSQLPGRTGVFSRPLCSQIQDKACEEYEPVEIPGQKEPGKLARFCRACEFACPVGKR
jgi:epoxyqueuosine reductase